MTAIKIGVREESAVGVSLDVDAVSVGGITHERGPSGGLREDARRNGVVMKHPSLLRVFLAAVEYLMGGSVATLTVECVEQVQPVVEDADRASAGALGSPRLHRVQRKRPGNRLGDDRVGVLIVGIGGI